MCWPLFRLKFVQPNQPYNQQLICLMNGCCVVNRRYSKLVDVSSFRKFKLIFLYLWCVCLLAKGNIAHWKEVFNVVEKLARKHEIIKQSLILMQAKVLFSYLEMLAPEKKVKIQIISSKRTQENEFVSYKLTEKVSPAFYHEELEMAGWNGCHFHFSPKHVWTS